MNKTDLNIDDFVRHFRNLMESADIMSPNDGHDFDDHIYESTFDKLDEEISRKEITKAIKKLKSNKSSSKDMILNELF